MASAESRRRVGSLDDLDARLASIVDPVPLLVIRLPALERTAWRDGLRKARALERRAHVAFAEASRRVLRTDDLTAHDAGSDVFVAVLTAPQRAGGADAGPIDARSALARIGAAIERAVPLTVDTGWTLVSSRDRSVLDDAIERALLRGAQERERYAFFTAIGHELRTPLSSIRGYLETLLDDSVDEETRRRFLTIAHTESLRLARLIEGMFEISMLDLHAARGASVQCELAAAVRAATDACASIARSRSVAVEVRIAHQPVAIDDDQLTLILINVIENAVKHGRFGGCVRIDAHPARAGRVYVDVDDDGAGIPDADRERIFSIGERGSTHAPGTGIGLAFVRLLLERASGGIAVGTSPLGGARFRIELRVPLENMGRDVKDDLVFRV